MGSGGNKKEGPPPPSSVPAVQAVNAPSVFEQLATQNMQKWADYQNAPGPHDITQAPGMDDMLDIYSEANAHDQANRLSNPQRALSGGGSGDYANQLDSGRRMQEHDIRAEGLSHGYQALKDQAYGLGHSAASMEADRKKTAADLMLNQQESYYRRPRQVPLWERLAKLGVEGAGAYFGG